MAQKAKQNGTTRAAACMEKAAGLEGPVIFAIGNAPTALVRIYELVQERELAPALVIGTPVGFVNVEQSKELICSLKVPYIIAKGQKGGSNVAAAVVNALLYPFCLFPPSPSGYPSRWRPGFLSRQAPVPAHPWKI